MDKNTEIFEKMPVSKAVHTMAMPTIVGQLIVLIYSIADTFFIGRTNNPYMVAGASIILPIFNIALSISGLAGIGGGALISRLLGVKSIDEARKVYSFSVYLSLFAAAFFSLSVLVFMKPLLYAVGAGPDTYEFAKDYAICVIVFGGIPTVLTNTLSNLIRSTGESKIAGFGVTMGGIINIVLDPLFMFVLLPDGMEIIGAGVATCLSNCISCTYFIVTIIRRKSPVLKMCSLFAKPEKKSIKSIFSIGVPSAITTLLFDLNYVIIDRLMAGYSDLALAAVGIVLKAERLPLNIGIGICQGMVPIVAYNYSAKNYKRMQDTKRYSCILGIVCAVASVILYEIFAAYIMKFFISDEQTVLLGTKFLRLRCLATPLMFLSFFHVHIFNGLGRGEYALLLGVTRWAVFNIPMLFILNRLIGMNGIVWAQAVADVFAVALSIIVYKRFERKNIDLKQLQE